MKSIDFKSVFCIAALSVVVGGCIPEDLTVGQLTDALDSSAWDSSAWISVVDAPVITGPISGDARAADGASWFLTTVQNGQKVVSAKWMTAGLGVYELYLNGVRVGDEFLKPGFTHYEKT